LVKIEFDTINGKPYFGHVTDEELLYIWVQVFKRDKDELFGITSTKALTRKIRATFKLKSPVKLKEVYPTATFAYIKYLVDDETEEITGRILGYDAIKPAELGELTKVTVKTNFGVEGTGVLAWLTLYGIPTANHGFLINPKSGLASDVYEAEIILKSHIEEFLPMYGQKVTVNYPGIPRMCNRCYLVGHMRRDCNNLKKEWVQFIIELVEGGVHPELIGNWSAAIKRYNNANANTNASAYAKATPSAE
jgi:hypothetical protein